MPKTHLGSTPMIVIYSLGLRANKNTGCALGGTSMSTMEPYESSNIKKLRQLKVMRGLCFRDLTVSLTLFLPKNNFKGKGKCL